MHTKTSIQHGCNGSQIQPLQSGAVKKFTRTVLGLVLHFLAPMNIIACMSVSIPPTHLSSTIEYQVRVHVGDLLKQFHSMH